MAYPEPFGPITEDEARAVERARAGAAVAAVHAGRHDVDRSFPVEGLAILAENGYLACTVPPEFGGEGAGVAAVALGNLEVGKGDASLGLAVSMHLGTMARMHGQQLWPESLYGQVAREVLAARSGKGALINSLATEPELGSPARGGMPRTRVERTPDGWRLTGAKTFSTGSPVLRWGIVGAHVWQADPPRSANFLVPMDSPGVRIEETWDTLGMRATGSHTVRFEGVDLPLEAEVPRPAAMPAGPVVPHERAWQLTVVAVYLGVAEAARDLAVQFARQRKPTALGGKSIATVPHIRQRAGRLDLQLFRARALLIGTARAWDAARDDAVRQALDGALVSAKLTTADTAVQVAEEAMRLVGGSSLDRASALERHFRDVRGGMHHPPQEDAALDLLARENLDLP